MAIHQRSIPDPPLADLVEEMWWYQGEAPEHLVERRLPDGAISLIINLRHDLLQCYDRGHVNRAQRYPGAVISGAHSEYILLDATCLTSVLGVQFKPGGAFPFLPFPASDTRNHIIPVDAVWGNEGLWLRERLLEARTPVHQFQIIEDFLLARLVAYHGGRHARRHPAHPAVALALDAFGTASPVPSVADVAERAGLSQTRFIQVFREAVGLTPKQFYRVERFQQILRSIAQGKPARWTELALASGYFDQAHFIHDFQAFSGLTPREYAALRCEHSNHAPLSR